MSAIECFELVNLWIEWGPGIYRADAACHDYDGTTARNTDRQQAARLAAILPAPLKRRPAHMNNYSALILERMRQMGWGWTHLDTMGDIKRQLVTLKGTVRKQ